ncbi:MAG: glycosyltransferase family 32 protein [Bacteroidales bacterium]
MAIPKVIYQTFKTSKLPLIFRWHISRLKKRNPNYKYEFYDDKRMNDFIRDCFGREYFALFQCLNIGAAKADFFRYAILYKKGGVYLDVDSRILKKIDSFISSKDSAVISYETKDERFFIQYALFFEAGHPFLKRTLEIIVDNLKNNRFPHDTHQMTGPTAFTKAVRECLEENPDINYRLMGDNYEGKVQFSFFMSKTFLYKLSRKNLHWKKISKNTPVIDSEKMATIANK